MEDRDAQMKRIFDLLQENNVMLHRLQSSMRFNRFFSTLKWVFIIGSFVAAYYYTLPYLGTIKEAYETLQKQTNTVQQFSTFDIKNVPGIENLLKNVNTKVPAQQ